MRYCGGKHRIATQLSQAILPCVGGTLWEPFCGGLSATVLLQPSIASDLSSPVIKLIEAVREGWLPPDFVTEEMYEFAREQNTPLAAFIGHSCSWGGKWWGGYAREGNRNFALNGKNSLLKKVKLVPNVIFYNISYEQIKPKRGDTVYCDPPYFGTTNGYASGDFDHIKFWHWVKYLAFDCGVQVFVSEFFGPTKFLYRTFRSKTDLRTTRRSQETTECLFRVVA